MRLRSRRASARAQEKQMHPNEPLYLAQVFHKYPAALYNPDLQVLGGL